MKIPFWPKNIYLIVHPEQMVCCYVQIRPWHMLSETSSEHRLHAYCNALLVVVYCAEIKKNTRLALKLCIFFWSITKCFFLFQRASVAQLTRMFPFCIYSPHLVLVICSAMAKGREIYVRQISSKITCIFCFF